QLIKAAIFLTHALSDDEHQREQNQHSCGNPQVAQRIANKVLAHESQNADGNGAHDDEPAHLPVLAAGFFINPAFEPACENLPDHLGEEDHYGKLCAKLNHCGEGSTCILAPKKLGHDPEVAGRTHGEKLG